VYIYIHMTFFITLSYIEKEAQYEYVKQRHCEAVFHAVFKDSPGLEGTVSCNKCVTWLIYNGKIGK
jgi:hypothetical protein